MLRLDTVCTCLFHKEEQPTLFVPNSKRDFSATTSSCFSLSMFNSVCNAIKRKGSYKMTILLENGFEKLKLFYCSLQKFICVTVNRVLRRVQRKLI